MGMALRNRNSWSYILDAYVITSFNSKTKMNEQIDDKLAYRTTTGVHKTRQFQNYQ